jgi:diguanylate cyclase (GGDEF)-like protein/PAS domain S-box-containing protein
MSCNPAGAFWIAVRDCIGVDTIALAGIFLAVSTIILTDRRTTGIRLGILIAAATLLFLTFEVVGFKSIWLLSLLVLARQVSVSFMASRVRPDRRLVASMVIFICLCSGASMLYAVLHDRPQIAICAVLTEIYLVAAIGFWNNSWQRTMALRAIVVGLVAWAAVFPVSLLSGHFLGQSGITLELWSIPKFCVAVGMILMVFEEDTRAARSLTEDYRLLFEANPHPLWVVEISTLQFLRVNQAALDAHGYTREEFLRLKVTDILEPGGAPMALRDTGSSNPASKRFSRHIRKDGSVLPLEITPHEMVFQGKPCRFVLGIDVTEREELERQLVRQAHHDALTGLPNRILFHETWAEAVRKSIQAKEKLAILCLDIHRFKRINDIYGVEIGDECLRRVTAILLSRAYPLNLVARTGDEEFSMALSGIKSAASVEQAATELRELLAEPLLIRDYKVQLNFSMGLAVCPDDGTDAMALWRGAESALRSAQAAGSAQTVWLSPELNRAAEEQIELEAYMRAQLEQGGFYLAYQPFYSFEGSVLGLEALLRLNHPTRGAVSPAEFIPIAEESGLIVPLGQWVLEEVCRQLNSWKQQGMRIVPIAVNVSGMQLMRIDYPGRVMDTLKRYAIDPQWIHLEVTETVAMRNLTEVSERMASLASRRICFSIDDFGTGHSSLGRLHQLPISVLKIDQSFIAQLSAHNGTYSIVQAIISMAHALGHRLVAEGVETASQLAHLRDLQCDLLQGFLLSRPVRPEQIPELVATRNEAFANILGSEDLSLLLPFEEDRIQAKEPLPELA